MDKKLLVELTVLLLISGAYALTESQKVEAMKLIPKTININTTALNELYESMDNDQAREVIKTPTIAELEARIMILENKLEKICNSQ